MAQPTLSDPPIAGAPAETILHASTVRIGNAAIVVTGPSGSGKSTLCLQLLAMGAGLIADDRTRLFERAGVLHADAPDTLPACIEARGVGLLPVARAGAAPVRLVIDMGRIETERLPPERNTRLHNHNVTLLHRSIATHFASAVMLHVQKYRDTSTGD